MAIPLNNKQSHLNINSQKEYKKMLKWKGKQELKIFYKILKEKLYKYGYLSVIQLVRLVLLSSSITGKKKSKKR